MSSSSINNATVDRDRKMKDLKKSLAWVEVLKFNPDDDDEIKQLKRNGA